MNPRERAQAAVLSRRREVQLDQGCDHVGALAVVEKRAARDGLSPGVEPRPERQKEIATAAQRPRLAKREEPMVLERHELLVQHPREHETSRFFGPSLCPKREYRCRSSGLSTAFGHASTTRDRSPRLCASVVASASVVVAAAPQSSASAKARSSRSSSASIRSMSATTSSRNPSASARPECARANRQPLAVVSRDSRRHSRGYGARVARSRLVDACAGFGEHPGILDCDPGVMPNVGVDVGRHERSDGRVVRSEPHAQRAHERRAVVARFRPSRARRSRSAAPREARTITTRRCCELARRERSWRFRFSRPVMIPVNRRRPSTGYSSSGFARLPKRSRNRSM